MKRWAIAIISLFITIVPSGLVRGEDSFSLSRIIEYALENSPDLKSASAGVKKAEGKKVKGMAGLLPKLTLEFTYTDYQEKHAIVPGIIGTKQRFDDEVMFGKVGLSFLLTDFGKTFYSYRSAKESYLATIKDLERRKEVVVYTVANLYFAIASLDNLIDSLRAVHKSLSELKRRIDLYVKNGRSARIDLLKINVRLAEIEDEISRLKRNRVELLGTLAQEMGYKGDLKLEEEIQLLKTDLDNLSFSDALEKALKHREDLSACRNLIKASQFGLKASKRAYWPRLSLFAGVGEFSGVSDDSRFSDHDRWEDDSWIGVKVNFPIFDGGIRKGTVLEAMGIYEAMEAKAMKVLLGVYKEIKKSIADIISSKKRLKLAKVSKEEAEETLRLERLKYELGKGVINNLLDAEAEKRKADYLYYSAIADYNTSVFEFYLAQGLLLERYDPLIHNLNSPTNSSK